MTQDPAWVSVYLGVVQIVVAVVFGVIAGVLAWLAIPSSKPSAPVSGVTVIINATGPTQIDVRSGKVD